MDAWQNLGFTPHAAIVRLARLAEEVGLTGVTLPEHLVNPSRVDTPNPYVPASGAGHPPTTPFLDPWVTFTALATVTERLRFLANVYVLPLRDLFGAAKAISAAAVLSGDRVSVGVGWIGVNHSEAELLPILDRLAVARRRVDRDSRPSAWLSRVRRRSTGRPRVGMPTLASLRSSTRRRRRRSGPTRRTARTAR